MSEQTVPYEYIGYRDQLGNILEEDDAQARIDAMNGAADPEETPLTIADLFDRVETADFWQIEIDNQEDNSGEPAWCFA